MVKALTNPFAGRPTPLGTLLATAAKRLSGELDAALEAAGIGDIRAAHAPIFMAVDPAGSTVSELATAAQLTKQATGELIRYLADRGYLEQQVDSSDRRVRRVRLTERGWYAVQVGERVIDDFDAWLAGAVGQDSVEALRSVLQRIIVTDPADR